MTELNEQPIIRIDKGVPLPLTGRKPIYPWREMEVGDSFFVPAKRKYMSGLTASAAKRTGYRFAVRNVVYNDVEGTRVWRIA